MATFHIVLVTEDGKNETYALLFYENITWSQNDVEDVFIGFCDGVLYIILNIV